MKKSTIIAIVIIAVIAVLLVIGGGYLRQKNSSTQESNPQNSSQNTANIQIQNVKDMEDLISKIYEKSGNKMFGLETRELNIKDEMELKSYTGLSSNKDIDSVVVSESMITATAYSVAVVKVKDNADVEAVKKEMVDNIDMRRWICVGADVVYAINSNNVIFLVMASEENAKPQYDAFKEVVGGTFGKELVRKSEELDF